MPWGHQAKHHRRIQERQGKRTLHGRYAARQSRRASTPRCFLRRDAPTMNFGLATYGLGLIAGALSTLSPCVLPLVPVLVASAVNAHRWGAMALGIGLALSFAIVGIFLATLGASLGLDPETFRTAGAAILALFGVILLVPKLQDLFAQAT